MKPDYSPSWECLKEELLYTISAVPIRSFFVLAIILSFLVHEAKSQGLPPQAIVAPSTVPTAGANYGGVFLLRPDSPGIGLDPCMYALKTSIPIAVSTATTTSLVAVSGTTSIYICHFDLMIAGSATTADTATLEYGTGATCTGTHALTGTYGGNDAAVTPSPLPLSVGGGFGTVLSTPASQGVCIVTTGTTVFVQGSMAYVQQ
jgi:hypothetical protein